MTRRTRADAIFARASAAAKTLLGLELANVNLYAVVCNRCGTIVRAETIEELIDATAKWKIAAKPGGDDYCPFCK